MSSKLTHTSLTTKGYSYVDDSVIVQSGVEYPHGGVLTVSLQF